MSSTSNVRSVDKRHKLLIWTSRPQSESFTAIDVDFNLRQDVLARARVVTVDADHNDKLSGGTGGDTKRQEEISSSL